MLELDFYERDNLLALLHLILVHHAIPLDTGDWLAQVYYKLAPYGYEPDEHHPNMTPKEQMKTLVEWARTQKG